MSIRRIQAGDFRKLTSLAGLCLLVLSGCGDCSGEGSGGGSNPGRDVTSDVGDIGEDLDSGPGEDVDTKQEADGDGADGRTDASDVSECAPENQCAESCCGSDELCLRDQCVLPGSDCAHNLDCASDEICEPSIGRCISDPGVVCEIVPEIDAFDPRMTLAWTDGPDTVAPNFNQVMMTPAVIDINEDGMPDIVFSTFAGGNYAGPAVLRAIDGNTYEPIFDLDAPEKAVSGSASVAVGDVDGDARNEIIAMLPSTAAGTFGLIAFDDHLTDWAVKWRAEWPAPVGVEMGVDRYYTGPALADLNADGSVEVVVSNRVYNAETGDLLCVATELDPGPLNTTVADLNGDGNLEVIAATGAFTFAYNASTDAYECETYWQYENDGYGFPAVGDFGTFTDGQMRFGELDGIPEVVSVAGRDSTDQVRLSNGQDGTTIWTATIPNQDHPHFSDAQCVRRQGGAPTIADFNGDGAPEIGTAGACFYAVFDGEGELLWKDPSQDFSSAVTGSSVFDFEGDGKAEVVYADECFLRVYDGTTGEVLFKRSHTSATTRELPVIVDVNNNYHAEIVLIANDYSAGTTNNCQNNWGEEFDALGGSSHGIIVIDDPEKKWVSTRPVWNQYTYHVTNVCDGLAQSTCPGRTNVVGAIPIGELPNWKQPGLNNFRQNVQGEGLFNAPDLAVTNIATDCNATEGLGFRITVSNLGTRGVPEGAEVAVYVSVDGTEQYLTTLTTTERLLPGGAQTIEYIWADGPDPGGKLITVRAIADANEAGEGQYPECIEDNNELINEASCICRENRDCSPGEFCASSGECLPMDG
ncbi:hypothetical protein [Bradymonas sediminis]|uniref:Uncharacterized protein n=1 Tax=Bradymonas sediminis TaxID=1548548 RepID=A0A2Z4FQN9_9DELT|nr:hypothetical protein [Bradymonas sediminis]AWV91202.1 hypothetical protein DN745_18470 [Bradymonas sediminis]TDP73767.1 hypothetical protein DFR33_10599 [Bradymonas sediminis]